MQNGKDTLKTWYLGNILTDFLLKKYQNYVIRNISTIQLRNIYLTELLIIIKQFHESNRSKTHMFLTN